MPAGLHMDDIVRAAMAAYVASSSSSSSSSSNTRSHSYDRNNRNYYPSSSEDAFGDLLRRGAHELGRLIRKFEKKSKQRSHSTGQDLYDDRFIEELSDEEQLPEYYPSMSGGDWEHRPQQPRRSKTIHHVHHRDDDREYDRLRPRRAETSYPVRGTADEYYHNYDGPAFSGSPSTERRKEKKQPSLKSLYKEGLSVSALMRNLPILLERADRILAVLDTAGSRVRSVPIAGKKMNYITALRAAVKLVKALQIGTTGMGGSSAYAGRR